jgi:hypothetical protein
VSLIHAAFAASGLSLIRDLTIDSAAAVTPAVRSDGGASTLEIGELSILKLTTPFTAGFADAIAAPIAATTGLYIPMLACTTLPT